MPYSPSQLSIGNWASPINIVGSDRVVNLDEAVNQIITSDPASLVSHVNTELAKIPTYLSTELSAVAAYAIAATDAAAAAALASQTAAEAAATAAAASQTAAAASASAASTSETNAAASASAAAIAKTAAEAAKTAAETAKTAAETAAGNASASATAAANSASAAATSATNAANSATAASNSASAAATSETNAAASAASASADKTTIEGILTGLTTIGTDDNAIAFSTSNTDYDITATAANITVQTMPSAKGKEGSITVRSADNVTGWGAEFRFAPDFSAVTPTPPSAMIGTMEFWYKVVEVNGVDGGTANIIHIAWAQ